MFNDQRGPLPSTQNDNSIERKQSGISPIPGCQRRIPECSPRKANPQPQKKTNTSPNSQLCQATTIKQKDQAQIRQPYI